MPNLTESDLDKYVEVYTNSLSPKTVRSYESAPPPRSTSTLTSKASIRSNATPPHIESYLLGLMTAGKARQHRDTPIRPALQPYLLQEFPLRAETRPPLCRACRIPTNR